MTKEARYIYQKRGVWYFSRRVPSDLQRHYKRPRIAFSLRTKSNRAAATRAVTLASKLEEDWLTIRWRTDSAPFSRFMNISTGAIDRNASGPLMTEASQIYLTAKGKSRPLTFTQAVNRSVRYLISVAGDKSIGSYVREDANNLRDALIARGLSRASIRRTLSVLRATINFTTRELGLDDIKVFSGVYLGEPEGLTHTTRRPIPIKDVYKIQILCHELDDEPRWLIALISDTGMRLSEAAGLIVEDVKIDTEYPHLLLRPHPWRRLKTQSSERVVPLAGASMWAAKRALNATSNQFLFPRYCNEIRCKGNSASAALNKWLSSRVPSGCVVHSFRHSFRDRLRAVECPPDIIDRLGGWSVEGVGEAYGNGYPLALMSQWIAKSLTLKLKRE